ncbi:hypothetical protein PoB_000626900 [Plakobranchus ocellatus]|uniref:Uncharacterized protein n=1 Tax=Plakobranchus ocellatus TaxID=259542 RepID=A0AAV3YCF7_9GAST|nr:hypothetical protein PoB_000626900 [Plakobranchus ocellatus]
MGNRRRNRAVPSPDHLEKNQAASSRNTMMMGNHTSVSINGGSHPRRQCSHHQQQARPGPQHETCNNPRCRHRHEGPHCTQQMSTQNCQIEFPLAVRTQSQPQHPQKPEPQDALTESSGQREAMVQSQPLPSDRPTQTYSNSVNSQELSVQSTPSNSADECEVMAPQQPLRLHQPCSVQTQSQPDNRQEHEIYGIETGCSCQELTVKTCGHVSRHFVRYAVKVLCESVEHSVAQHFITEAIHHNATETQNNAIVIQHRVAIAQHLAEEALHNAKVTQHFVTVTEHIAAAVPNNDVVTQHIIAATQHIIAATRHNDAATQRRSALRQHIAAATHNNAATRGKIPDYHSNPDNSLSEDKIQEIPTRQFSRSADRSGSDQTSCVFCMCD